MPGRRQARRHEIHALSARLQRIAHLQGQPQQCLGRIDADLLHQRQGSAIGAQQDVLAIVQRASIQFDAARPPSEGTCGLEQADAVAGGGQGHGGSATGPAGADHGMVAGSVLH